jgi:lipopolysaccharide/colanic/teichoic acid biosynthesis glycosyltransferase
MDQERLASQTVDSDRNAQARQHAGVNDQEPVNTIKWPPPPSSVYSVTKRAIDMIVSAVALILMLPALFAIALAVRLSSEGPIIYRTTRIGYKGRRLTLWKFRTMYSNSGDRLKDTSFVSQLISGDLGSVGSQAVSKLKNDPRITPLGRFLRLTSLDELPQLWSVLRGDMSLVGPRPAIPYELEKTPAEYMRRFAVVPGITGLWQVSGRSHMAYDTMLKLDLEYVERQSILLDLVILVRTIGVIMLPDKAY